MAVSGEGLPASERSRPYVQYLVVFALVVVLGAAFARVVLVPAENCFSVSEPSLRTGVTEAIGWFERNQNADGSWLYRYDREANQDLGSYNAVRHSGVMMSLYQAAKAGFPDALAIGDRGLPWAQAHLYRTGDMAMVEYGPIETGATALLAAGLVQRREHTGDTAHDADLLAMGRFLLGQVEPNGAVSADFDKATGRPVVGTYLAFYTGETWWALTLLARTFPSEPFGAAAAKVGRYAAAERDDAEGLFPPTSDHWGSYALAETTAAGELDDLGAWYTGRVGGIVGMQVRWESQRTDRWPNWWLRGRSALPAGVGTLGEASAALWRVSQGDERVAPLHDDLARRARCVAGRALDRQVSPAESTSFADADRTRGAWFQFGITQMDDQQHSMSTLLGAIPIVLAGDGEGPERHWQTPVAWLLMLLVVAAVNPVRASLALRPVRRQWTLAGAAGSGLVAVVLALVADPLLDALDISAATARIAAGMLLIVAAAIDLLRTPKLAVQPTGTWRDALVPAAIPVTLRPALLVLAVSAGADRGAGWVALGALIAVGLLAAPWPRGDRADVVLRWTARVTAAAQLACAVILTASGVLSI